MLDFRETHDVLVEHHDILPKFRMAHDFVGNTPSAGGCWNEFRAPIKFSPSLFSKLSETKENRRVALVLLGLHRLRRIEAR